MNGASGAGDLTLPQGTTKTYPIVGDPVDHLRSPELLSRSFRARGLDALCLPWQVREGDLEAVFDSLRRVPQVPGILVTMPHKHAAAALCGTLSAASQRLGAVSVVRRNPQGTWHGDILDGPAFVGAQVENGAAVAGARVLLVGLGGAGSAIGFAFLEAGVGQLVVFDRQRERVDQFLGALRPPERPRVVFGPPDPAGCQLACNATPLGLETADPLPFDTDRLTPGTFVGDVVSGPRETKLMALARARGCRTADGNAMVAAVQGMMVAFFLAGAGGPDLR